MKNTITKLVTCAFIALASFTAKTAKAQTTQADKWRLGVGLELGRPVGSIHPFSNFELGGTARLQYGLSNSTALTLTSGYYNLFGSAQQVTDVSPTGTTTRTEHLPSFGIVPVKLGIKSFLAHRLYFGAEAGAGFETVSYGNTKLILAPTLGYATKVLDLGLRYEAFLGQNYNYGLIGLRIAYGFGL